jgi:hypothetical protein
MAYIGFNVYKHGRYVNGSGSLGFPSKRYPLLAQGVGEKLSSPNHPLPFFFPRMTLQTK